MIENITKCLFTIIYNIIYLFLGDADNRLMRRRQSLNLVRESSMLKINIIKIKTHVQGIV